MTTERPTYTLEEALAQIAAESRSRGMDAARVEIHEAGCDPHGPCTCSVEILEIATLPESERS